MKERLKLFVCFILGPKNVTAWTLYTEDDSTMIYPPTELSKFEFAEYLRHLSFIVEGKRVKSLPADPSAFRGQKDTEER